MAATATAQSSNTQNFASNLRSSQHAAQVAQTQPIRDIPNVAPNNSPIVDSDNSQTREQQFAEAERQYKIQQATVRDILPSQTEENEKMWYQEQENRIREESEALDVSQLGPIRAAKQKFLDQAAKRAAQAIKEKAREKVNRMAVLALDEVGGGIVEITEGSLLETDLGIGTVGDLAYDYARLGVTVLIPAPTDVGSTAGETAKYTANKTIHTLIPPYKFVFGGAGLVDIIDDAFAVFKLGIASMVLLVLALFAAIIISIAAYAWYTFGSVALWALEAAINLL